MNNCLDNIFVPISKRLDVQKAVTKAIELAGSRSATIHLVQIIRDYNPLRMFRPVVDDKGFPGDGLDGYLRTLIDLIHWKNFIEKKAPELTVKIHIKKGLSLQILVAQLARREKSGLIISAAQLKWNWFLQRDAISVLERKVELDKSLVLAFYNTLSGKRRPISGHSFTPNGLQVLLSHN